MNDPLFFYFYSRKIILISISHSKGGKMPDFVTAAKVSEISEGEGKVVNVGGKERVELMLVLDVKHVDVGMCRCYAPRGARKKRVHERSCIALVYTAATTCPTPTRNRV